MPRAFWRDGPRIPSLILFGLFAISLLGGIAAIFHNMDVERREREQVRLTSDILTELRLAGRAMINAETGQRGYVITSDPSYLAPYHAGSREWPASYERLQRLLDPVATPHQRELVERMGQLGDEKLAELGMTIDLVDRGQRSEAMAVVDTDIGRNAMVEFRDAIGELEDIERDILAQAMEDARVVENRLVPILLALLAVMIAALALGLWQIIRVARAETAAQSARSLAEARDRADLLSQELNHRVKNMFAVILAIVRMSLRGNPDPNEAAKKITDRINALSVAHSVTQGQLETPVAQLEDLVRTAVAPYVTSTTQLEIEGPNVEVVARQITPLGMILHELVTNCVKYGAWSEKSGALAISWRRLDEASGKVELAWIERVPITDTEMGEDGFGSRMIVASTQQLDGRLERELTSNGLQLRLTFEAHPEAAG